MASTYEKRPGANFGVSQHTAITTSIPPTSYPHQNNPKRKNALAGSTPEVMLNVWQMRRAASIKNHPYVRMCLNEITKRLFSGKGIVLVKSGQIQQPSASFATFLKRDMIPFVREALDAIMCFGVVPIAFRPADVGGIGEKSLVPHVPAFGTYIITTWADLGVQQFRFYWSTLATGTTLGPEAYSGEMLYGPFGDEDDNVMVIYDFGYNPHLNGTLTSNMNTIATQMNLTNELTQHLLTAERILSNPPLVTEYNSKIDDGAQKKFQENYFVGNYNQCLDRAEATFERSAQQAEVFKEEMMAWEDYTGLNAAQEFGVPDLHRDVKPKEIIASRARMPWDRQYFVGTTRNIASYQLPQTRSDYVAIVEQSMDVICGVLNVPRDVLANASNISASVEASTESMHRTTSVWADLLSSLMCLVYDHLFGKIDLRDELRTQVKTKRKIDPYQSAQNLLTEADVFSAIEKVSVRLAFDLPPFTTVENLSLLYDRGIIDWNTYGKSMLRVNGFYHDQLAATKDPFTKEEQRQLIFGKPKESEGGGAKKKKSPAKKKKK